MPIALRLSCSSSQFRTQGTKKENLSLHLSIMWDYFVASQLHPTRWAGINLPFETEEVEKAAYFVSASYCGSIFPPCVTNVFVCCQPQPKSLNCHTAALEEE